MEVSGTIALGENLAAGQALQRRLLGWRRYGFMALWVWLGVALSYAVHLLTRDEVRPAFLMLILALAPVLIMDRWGRGIISQGWRALGAPNENAGTFVVTSQALVIRTDDGEIRRVWPMVLQIAEERTFWLFVVAEMSFFLPKRFFTNPAEHRAFIAECLAYLTPEARARSADAERFVTKVD